MFGDDRFTTFECVFCYLVLLESYTSSLAFTLEQILLPIFNIIYYLIIYLEDALTNKKRNICLFRVFKLYFVEYHQVYFINVLNYYASNIGFFYVTWLFPLKLNFNCLFKLSPGFEAKLLTSKLLIDLGSPTNFRVEPQWQA